ncbi:general secretion pathway protein [Flavobacterium limi]|uniref:general secretion pathway protein n=2 Tax=Flavobacterium limi TaxID=2045105 RepID=UPI0013D6E694|nr:general secretion pathway protein [Flavobacterium limi]
MKLNKKNKLLIVGFVLILYICYSFAISNTVIYYNEYHKKEQQIANDSNLPNLANQLIRKEKQLDQVLDQNEINVSDSFQNDLLKQLSSYSNTYHLKITDFQEPHTIIQKGFTTTSYIFSLEGSFNGCLALLNQIENNPKLGAVKHLNFIKKKNYKTDMDQLFVEVIMQTNKGI